MIDVKCARENVPSINIKCVRYIKNEYLSKYLNIISNFECLFEMLINKTPAVKRKIPNEQCKHLPILVHIVRSYPQFIFAINTNEIAKNEKETPIFSFFNNNEKIYPKLYNQIHSNPNKYLGGKNM